MLTLYKIYMTILVEKMRKEVEEKELLPQKEIEFKKRTMDNIYDKLLDKPVDSEEERKIYGTI